MMILRSLRSNLPMVALLFPLGISVFFFPGSNLDYRIIQCSFELFFILVYSFIYIEKESVFLLPGSVFFLFVLWAAWAVLSLVMSERLFPSLMRQWEWFCQILFCLCMWGYFKEQQQRIVFAHAMILTGCVLVCAVFFCFWYYLPDPVTHNWVIASPHFSNIRHFSHYCTAALILSLALFFSGEDLKINFCLLFALLVLFWGFLFWTGGRGGILSAAVGVSVGFSFVKKDRSIFLTIAICAMAAGFIGSGFFEVENYSLGGLNSVLRSSGNFLSGRLFLWKTSLIRVVDSPLWGLGPDAFRFFPEMNYSLLHPHNAFVQFLVDWGAVGTFLFMIMWIKLMYKGLAGVIVEKNQILNGIKVSCFVLLVAFIVYALVDGVFYFPIPLTIMAYAFAVILLPASTSQNLVKMSCSQIRLTGITVRFMALVLLVVPCLHLGVVQSLKSDTVPRPFTFQGRLVRFFPSETRGAEHWLKVWAKSYPDLAFSASMKFANSSMNSQGYWKIAVRLLLDKKDFSGASRMAEKALDNSATKQKSKLLKEFQALGLPVD